MTAADLIDDLLGSGRVRVARDGGPPAGLSAAVDRLDRLARSDLPGVGPALLPAVGEWALLLVYRACQALAHRDLESADVRASLSVPCPGPRGPRAAYSADLALRVLPDLIRLARGVAPDDPLVDDLMSLAKAWPLSAVGVAGLGEVELADVVADGCLLRVYADRVIERNAVAALADPRVRAEVRAAIGGHPDLAPAVAAALDKPVASEVVAGGIERKTA